MTREDLAKDILLTMLPRWLEVMEKEPADAWKGPMRMVSQTSVELADALLEALGAKEAPASWLSKEMRTPAKGFPAIRTVEPGVSVVIREPGHVCDGMFGIVASKFGAEDLWNVDIGKTTHAVLSCSSLEVR